jgi:hypothetical protein
MQDALHVQTAQLCGPLANSYSVTISRAGSWKRGTWTAQPRRSITA